MFGFTVVIVLAIWLVAPLVGAALLSPYNKAGSGAVIGLLFGPLGTVIAALMAVTEELKKQSELTLKLATMAAVKERKEAEATAARGSAK